MSNWMKYRKQQNNDRHAWRLRWFLTSTFRCMCKGLSFWIQLAMFQREFHSIRRMQRIETPRGQYCLHFTMSSDPNSLDWKSRSIHQLPGIPIWLGRVTSWTLEAHLILVVSTSKAHDFRLLADASVFLNTGNRCSRLFKLTLVQVAVLTPRPCVLD